MDLSINWFFTEKCKFSVASWSFRGKSRVWSLVSEANQIFGLIFHYFTFVTTCSVWVSSLMSNVVLCNHSTYVDTLLQFFLQKLAPSWWSAKSVENWLWTLCYHGKVLPCFGFCLTYATCHTLIMASIHGPSIVAHPTSFQAHSTPSPRMGFHPDLEHSMVNIYWCYVLCGPDLLFFKVWQPELSTVAHAGYVPDPYYGHEHTDCLCAHFITHLFACNKYHGSSSKLPYFIAHSLPDKATLICDICSSPTPPVPEGLLPHHLWLIQSTSLYYCVHDCFKGDIWWQILQ